ncbi:thiopeptide-type bacteriocin biosynthesis protein [Mucilaginibacter sp. KACC 22773]|nr:thiopeptide-type bacteriocin biosynthesis protein [Mucilaginibacter sp. KACC 22773]WDF80757.1 thiopeptide-type bacteriocin biosynthesis protein [Mucilaginibacter sp. KACC 22773]
MRKAGEFPGRGEATKRIDWTPVHQLFLKTWQRRPSSTPFAPLIIHDDEVSGLGDLAGNSKLPPSISMLFTKSADKLVLENNGGATATALTGRFNVFSEEANRLCQEIARAEAMANPDVLFAEIHQLSDIHVDNINRRKPVYDHIIHINTFPCPTGQQQIRLDDLQVSIQGDDILLESVSLKKRVIPRLPTAYNFNHNELAIFRFLCDLQYQGLQANLTFNLEQIFPGLDFYPRVEYRGMVISLAKWRLQNQDIAGLITAPSIGKLHIMRQVRGIPALVSMGMSDQKLVFDLSCDAEALFFMDCLKEQQNILITEYLEPDRSVTAGKNRLAGQFVALLTRTDRIYNGIAIQNSPKRKALHRSFPPGSQWLYFKIYCAEETSDTILLKLIGKLSQAAKAKIELWFFIRYYDPESHIRLRIRTDISNYGEMVKTISRIIGHKSVKGFVRDVKQDTYVREVERYSAALMENVEHCFHTGSELVVQWLNQKIKPEAPNGFDMAVFRLVYQMAARFAEGSAVISDFFRQRAESFISEFGDTRNFRLDLDRKYRMVARELEAALEHLAEDPKTKDIVAETAFLKSVENLAKGSAAWADGKRLNLLADLIHMQVNRLYSDQQRRHELLICFCLYKYSTSLVLRDVAY